jgi:hypothetical protein
MTKKKLASSEQLDRLDDILVEDILALSDEEVIAEARDRFGDPKIEVERLHGVIEGAILCASKAKLAEAQAAVGAHKRENRVGKVIMLSAAQKRVVIERFVAQDPELQQKLTLAARKGKGIQTGNDIDGMIEDLIELGVIDEQGNPN